MRLHRRVTRLQVGGQHDGGRRRVTALFPPTFEGKAHRIRVRHIALQRIVSGADEKALAGRNRRHEAIRSAMLASGAFLLDQRLDMGGILENRELQIGGAGTTDPPHQHRSETRRQSRRHRRERPLRGAPVHALNAATWPRRTVSILTSGKKRRKRSASHGSTP
jgi:hypothetical protein